MSLVTRGTWRIAVVGADEPIGEALIKTIEEREPDGWDVLPVSLGEAEGCASYRDEALPCIRADELDWRGIDVAVFASRGPSAQQIARRAAERSIPVVIPQGFQGVGGPAREVADAPAAALIRVLRPLASRVGLRALSGFVGVPVSVRGRAAIDELVDQTRALFAMETAEAGVFPVRIAFNLIPQVGDIGADGHSTMESTLAGTLRGVFGEALATQFTAVWIPTFYGGTAVLHGQSERTLSVADLRDWLARVPGVTVMDDPLPGGAPTPATDAVDSADVFVGRLRVDDREATRFSLWLTYDHPRLEAAQLLVGLEKFD